MGVDLDLKSFATCSNGKIYKNINKTSRIRKLEKKLNNNLKGTDRYDSSDEIEKIAVYENKKQ